MKFEIIVKYVIGVFSLIGFLSTILFVFNLFNNNENAKIKCEKYIQEKNDINLENRNLVTENEQLKYSIEELEDKLENMKEEYNDIKDDCKIDSFGSAKIEKDWQ